MDIKSIENKFLEQMVDRMDSISGLTYNNVFLSYTCIENVDSYNLALFNINEKLKNRSDFLVIENGLDELESKLDLNLLSNIVSLSTNPGKFVCNNIYYHLLTNYPSKSIFIHIPHCHDDINEYKKYANEITIIINKIKEQLDK